MQAIYGYPAWFATLDALSNGAIKKQPNHAVSSEQPRHGNRPERFQWSNPDHESGARAIGRKITRSMT
jgi:hypothetical protein